MRIAFDKSNPGADVGHVHVTDGLRYRVQPTSYQVGNALTKAAGPIATLTSADLPSGWDFGKFRQVVCGNRDPGEYAPPTASSRYPWPFSSSCSAHRRSNSPRKPDMVRSGSERSCDAV